MDVRVQWVGERLLSALGHKDPAPFKELLNCGDGEEAEKLLHFLNVGTSTEESEPAALFFQQEMRLKEIDIEIGAQNDEYWLKPITETKKASGRILLEWGKKPQ